MKTIFVTGGAGFIGSAFVHLVLKENADVEIVNFDALTYAGNLENLEGLGATRHRFVKGDIRNKAEVFDALPNEADAIFNFAAESHVDRSIASASEFVTTNVLGTQILLDAARAKNIRRFVQISTDEIHGSLPENENAFFTEESPVQPNSPYAASKAAAEHFVRAAVETFKLDGVITRCGNNYGQRQFPEKLIPLMIANATNDEPLPVYGDGQNVRDWIFVGDHARAIWLAFEKGKSGESYNIGARNERRNIEVVESILDALRKPRSLIKFVEDRPGHDRRYAIDPTKAETELGWKPQTTWEEGLRKTVRWYLENQDWVNRIRNGAYRDYYKNQYKMEVGSTAVL
ncbi:MAG: dTDP-glucose 4,6-dehydratase [Pyrinomonadaceae bacterium]